MTSIGPLGQNFNTSPATSSSTAARSADTDNGLGKIASDFSGIEGLGSSANSASFSLSNPGFGNRGTAGQFSVQNFLG